MRPIILAVGIAVIVLICSTATAQPGYLVHPAPVIYAYMPPAAIAYPPPVITVPAVEVPYAVARPAVMFAPASVVYPGVAVVRTKVYYRGQPVRNALKAIVW
jgi:hypothetical protein